MVMPRSRSISMESSSWACMSRLATVPVSSRMRSESVDLPWSMCAMIEKLRIWESSWVIISFLSAAVLPGERAREAPLPSQCVRLAKIRGRKTTFFAALTGIFGILPHCVSSDTCTR